jgi:hypothetical protein
MENQKLSKNGCEQFQTPSQPQDPTMEGSKEVNASDEPASDGPISDESVVFGEDAYEYLTGFKLVLVISTGTMVAFLILLDSSIVATVRHES